MELQTINTPQFPEAMTLPEQARAIVIRDQETYTTAACMKVSFGQWRKRIVEEFAPMKEAAHKAHKAITSKEAEYLAPVTEAEDILKRSLRTWADHQEGLRQIEQRRMEAEARAAAEADRLRREAEATIARAEAERIHAEARKAEEAERLEKAMALEAVGAAKEIVDYVLAEPIREIEEVAPLEAYMEPAPYIAPVVAAPTFTAAKGLGMPRTWACMVTNIRELCAAVSRGEVPESYVEGVMPALNKRASAEREFFKVPGCKAYQK